MAGCMVSRSNRFCVRISVPDPAMVCLQVAFGMCGLGWLQSSQRFRAISCRCEEVGNAMISNLRSPRQQVEELAIRIALQSCKSDAARL